MITETVTWISVQERLPDTDRLVLVCTPYETDGCPPVWGWYCNGQWTNGRRRVTHWAETPVGPIPKAQQQELFK